MTTLNDKRRYVNDRVFMYAAFLSRDFSKIPLLMWWFTMETVMVISLYITYPFFYVWANVSFKLFKRIDRRLLKYDLARYEAGGDVDHDYRIKRGPRKR